MGKECGYHARNSRIRCAQGKSAFAEEEEAKCHVSRHVLAVPGQLTVHAVRQTKAFQALEFTSARHDHAHCQGYDTQSISTTRPLYAA